MAITTTTRQPITLELMRGNPSADVPRETDKAAALASP